jgi:hypothetical protein
MILGVATGLITGGIFEIAFHTLLGATLRVETRRANDELKSEMFATTDMLRKELSRVSDMFEGAQHVGLRAVLPPRLDGGPFGERGTGAEHTKRYIVEHLKGLRRDGRQTEGAIEVRIAGISLHEFFDVDNPYFEALHDFAIDGSQGCAPIHLRVLLMDPIGDAIKLRLSIEEGDARIRDHIKHSFVEVRHLIAEAENAHSLFDVEVKFCDYSPHAYALITPQSLFVEQYHFAPKRKLRELLPAKPNLWDDANPCGGGRVPLLEYDKDSSSYAALKAHFDTLWENAPETCELVPSWDPPHEPFAVLMHGGVMHRIAEQKKTLGLPVFD